MGQIVVEIFSKNEYLWLETCNCDRYFSWLKHFQNLYVAMRFLLDLQYEVTWIIGGSFNSQIELGGSADRHYISTIKL